jgi:hypothetical protein
MWTTAARWLPPALRRRLVLSRATRDPRLADVRFTVVSTRAEALAAATLVHDAYVGRRLLSPHPSGLHVSQRSASPCTWAFLATRGDEPIGTISMVVDSDAGLPMEAVYGAEIAALRADGSRLAEVGAFAVSRPYRGTGLLFPLMWTMWRMALELSVDRFTAAVHPDAAWFYGDLLSFRVAGAERRYPGLNASARAVGLVSPPFDEIEDDYARLFDRLWPLGGAQAESGAPARTSSSRARRAARQALMRARPDVIPRRPSLLGEITASAEAR